MNAEIMRGQKALAELRKTLESLHRRALALLVEDDVNDIFLIREVFKRFSVDLDVSTGVEDAVERLRCRKYDAVFVDLKLSDGSGLDIISRAVGHQIDTFFIVVTGVDDSNPMIVEALERGAKCVIQKPITEDHLRLIFGSVP